MPLTNLLRWIPDLNLPGLREQGRASLGALVGVLVAGLMMPLLVGPEDGVPLLIAPIGASAVLLFAAPSSPLAQPWSILGGNVSAALVAVLCRTSIADPMIAAPVAVGAAIAVMFALRCLHPPGGAVAVFTVLATPASQDLGYAFALMPVGLSSLLLLATAFVFNNLTGHRYPHLRRNTDAALKDVETRPQPLQITSADLDAALRDFGEIMPIDRDDLVDVLEAAAAQARRRRASGRSASDLMRRSFAAVSADATLAQAWRALRKSGLDHVVIVDRAGRAAGVATESDFLRLANRVGPKGPTLRVVESFGISTRAATRLPENLARETPVAGAASTASELARMMLSTGTRHLPITNVEGKAVGVVSIEDVLSALSDGDHLSPSIPARAA